jgi:NAD(P)-dependent dehydrogenase (short-subunit alcohol dehydrogenase family)
VKLRDQVAIVTGGGRGIGESISLRFAAEGAAVTVAGTGRAHLETVARRIRDQGGRAIASITDVTDEAAVEAMVAATMAEFGRLDVLVNNAGIAGPIAPLEAITLEDWNRTLAINLTGAFLCSKHVLPRLVAQRSGRILHITSIAGQMGYPMRAPYAASKWAMIGLMRTMAIEAGESGVTVNAIAPGPVSGERIEGTIRRRAEQAGVSEAEVRKGYLEPTALKRFVDPEEIAAMAVYLASDEARSITGETLTVSAGFRV